MLRKTSFRKHCSDELLLGYLDGELSFRTESFVRKHLRACWECRAHLTELEQQAHAVAKALADSLFPGADRIREAKRRFSIWEQHFEEHVDPAPRLCLLATSSLGRQAAAATGVLCLVITGIWFSYRLRSPRAIQILAATQKFEREFYQGPLPLHQSIRVETALGPLGSVVRAEWRSVCFPLEG
jgi:anti-sigma factor RsiW